MGYVLANPLEFAWPPTETDFTHGPCWGGRLGYVALFGSTGLFFAAGAERGAVLV